MKMLFVPKNERFLEEGIGGLRYPRAWSAKGALDPVWRLRAPSGRPNVDYPVEYALVLAWGGLVVREGRDRLTFGLIKYETDHVEVDDRPTVDQVQRLFRRLTEGAEAGWMSCRPARKEQSWPQYEPPGSATPTYGTVTAEIPEMWALVTGPSRIGQSAISYAPFNVRYKGGYFEDRVVPGLAACGRVGDLVVPEPLLPLWALGTISEGRGLGRLVVTP